MPPEVSAIPPPVGRQGVRAWLESRGIVARVPAVRSRDFSLINTCRFLYYLTRRLSISSPFRDSDALRHGSWFHTRFEAVGLSGPQLRAFMQQRLAAREAELRGVCKLLDIGQEATAQIVATEKEDCLTTWAWFEAAAQFRRADVPAISKGFDAFFANLKLRCLGKELRLCLNHEHRYAGKLRSLTLIAQVDELRYNPESNLLWIVDPKTTSSIPRERAATIPCEFQPRHFSHIVNSLLDAGLLQRHFNLPADVKFGGFIHLLIQKPSIRMGQNDRPYYLESHGLRKKMKGRAVPLQTGGWACSACDLDRPDWPAPQGVPLATEEQAEKWLQEQCGKLPDRIHSGEPSFDIYKSRCVHWYNGTGDYVDALAQRNSVDMPVNISTMPASSILDDFNMAEYRDQLARVCDYALCPAEPSNFDRTSAGMEIEHLAPFYLAPPSLWPALMLEKRLLQLPWDEDITTLPDPLPSSILPRETTK